MKLNNIKILAIETSCDETAAAVICGTNENPKFEIRNSKSPLLAGSLLKAGQIQNSKNQIPKILSSIVSSQADLHAKTGGVVPEVASRAHMEAMMPVLEMALKQAKLSEKLKVKGEKCMESDSLQLTADNLSGITHIAVTAGPGLIGSLLVGFNTAKAIAAARNLPLIPINHIEGHIYSATVGEVYSFPLISLTVSGGHTSLTLMKNHGKYETIGETIDDAAGEAFDKVAKLLDLGYPGGPIVSKFASEFRSVIARNEAIYQKDCHEPKKTSALAMTIEFPRPLLNRPNFDFSFSGLKTAVLTEVNKRKAENLKPACRTSMSSVESQTGLTTCDLHEICFAFEEAVVDVLVTKALRAVEKYQPKSVILAGGVAANGRLREELSCKLSAVSCKLLMPEISLCGDNAAMIGIAAFYHILAGEKGLSAEALAEAGDWRKAKVDSNLEL